MTTEFKYLDYEGLKLFKEKLEHLRLADKTDIVEVLNEISNGINDGKLSIYINGTLLNEFTANQAGNTDVNIIVPTELGDLSNSVEFIKNVIKYGQPDVSDLTDDQKESLHNQTSEESKLVSEDALETTLASYGTNINYDTEHQKIQLRHNNTVLSEIDAADFIKDSMIQDISVTDGTGDNAGQKVLLIDFNSESGVQDIEIPISEFFNPDNYYVKTDFANVALSGSYTDLSNTPSTLTQEEVNQGTNSDGKLVTAKIIRDSIDSAITGGNSKVVTDDNLSEKVLTAGFAKSVQVGNNTPTIADVNGVLFVPEQKQVDWNENNTSDKAYIKNKPIVYNLSEIQNIVKYGQADVSELTDEEKTEAEQENGFVKNSDLPEYEISGSNYTWNFKKNNETVSTINIPEPQIPTTLSSFTNDVPFLVQSDIANLVDSDSVYTKNEIDQKIEYISNGSITLSNYYNKTQVNNLLSGLSYNNLQDLPTIPDAQIQSDWNQTDTSAKDYIKNKPNSINTYSNLSYTTDYTLSSASGNISVDCSNNIYKIVAVDNISAISLTGVPEEGHSCHFIIKINNSETITIALSNQYTFTLNEITYSLICPKNSDLILSGTNGEYIEFDILRLGNELFVRGV